MMSGGSKLCDYWNDLCSWKAPGMFELDMLQNAHAWLLVMLSVKECVRERNLAHSTARTSPVLSRISV